MVTRSASFGPTATVADTESTIGSAYSFPGSGIIKNLRIAGYNGVTDKATSAILYLYFKKLAGPFEFACYGAGEEVTVGGKRPTEIIQVDIPYNVGEQVTVKVKAAEALEEVTVSLTMVE
jgi:hypothetical protein